MGRRGGSAREEDAPKWWELMGAAPAWRFGERGPGRRSRAAGDTRGSARERLASLGMCSVSLMAGRCECGVGRTDVGCTLRKHIGE